MRTADGETDGRGAEASQSSLSGAAAGEEEGAEGSQTQTLRSEEADTRARDRGSTRQACTGPSCPLRTLEGAVGGRDPAEEEGKSHSAMVPSSEAVKSAAAELDEELEPASSTAAGLAATEDTPHLCAPGPSFATGSAAATSQRMPTASRPPESSS